MSPRVETVQMQLTELPIAITELAQLFTTFRQCMK